MHRTQPINNPLVIAYDLGTGGVKASVFNRKGAILHSVFTPYPTYFPEPDFQEQSPEEWWQAVVSSTRRLLGKPGINAPDIVALAISGHSLGVVPVDTNGTLLRTRTPIWSDKRAAAEADDFFSRIDYAAWYRTTGNGFPPACYPVFKIMWYRKHEPEMFARIHRVIGTKDYCNYRLTGRLCTDYSYASGSGVFDLQRWEYRNDYIGAAGLSPELFPELLASDAVIGTLTPEASRETGLPPHVKVCCGGVDNSCMALGAKGTEDNRIYTSLGSSAWVAVVSKQPVLDFEHKPYVFAHTIRGMYASATCIFSAGSSYQWIRNTLCPDLQTTEREGGTEAYEAMNRLAAGSPPGANGILFNPSLAGGSMLEPSPDLCGAFTGLRLQHTRADMIRAALEGITLNLRIALDLLRSYRPDIHEILIVGGGAKSPFWMQLFADIYGIPVEKTNIDQEAASLGAAALALKGTGYWSDYSTIDTLHRTECRYEPDHTVQTVYAELLERFRTLSGLLSAFAAK